jgi:serine phosphatase RsbU (regulator of sigma subunit)
MTRLSTLWKNLVGGGETDRALDLMVLQTLDAFGPQHGYSIASHLEQFSTGAVRSDLRTFYVSVKRLEQRGFVRARWDVTDSNRKARFYAITAIGRRQLETEKAEWDRRSMMHRFLREHEKQKRELEIAREVQERLFPQEYPAVPGFEYAGACRPAYEVGGDYYDFIALSESEIGIAIGDVSGKGISASLLMATVRAYVRGLTAAGSADLCGLMSNLNRLVGESSPIERYATFFYGQFNFSTRKLIYVNGGHPPPFLLRGPGADDALRLDVGGPVIGLLPDCSYEQGAVHIETGDVLVAFTDGISEARNADDLEWGEERLTAAIQSNRARVATDLIRSIMVDVDRYVAEAPQYDDMTLVVLRFLDVDHKAVGLASV